jgi:hypothetical protein
MGGNKGEEVEAKPSVVGLHYRVGRKIGEGSFGAIYEGNGHSILMRVVGYLF